MSLKLISILRLGCWPCLIRQGWQCRLLEFRRHFIAVSLHIIYYKKWFVVQIAFSKMASAWRHDMETLSVWLGRSKRKTRSVINSPNKGPVMRSFGVSSWLTWSCCWANIRVTGDLRSNDDHVTSIQWKSHVFLVLKFAVHLMSTFYERTMDEQGS